MICIQPWPLPAECASPEQFLLPNTAIATDSGWINLALLIGVMALTIAIGLTIGHIAHQSTAGAKWHNHPHPELRPHAAPNTTHDQRTIPRSHLSELWIYPATYTPPPYGTIHNTRHPGCKATWDHEHGLHRYRKPLI